ncbi:membrane biogenesis protein [Vagococcus sp. BWB3-3]|uniref:Membrane biogenesis protein n=1 Tax=Vagococcus allomyrinae TaxID=2794353 RepID=A0A940SRK6_9ENTE|nr:BtpA/SgcQ family protein [Vagococcus allomyrinae]MBP1040932.1 membrane biogenesis protein [Vagococcus allomyrinae]
MEKKTFLDVFKTKKPIIAMIHLKGDSEEEIQERAKKEIAIYAEEGVDCIMMENYYGDYVQLEKAIQYIVSLKLGIPIGVNCLNLDAMGFYLANKYELDIVQVDSVVGHVKPRDEATLQAFFDLERSQSKACLIGGVRFKYQPELSEKSLAEDLAIAKTRCDAVAVTQNATGEETSMAKIQDFREALGAFPLVVAAGVTDENVLAQLAICDAAIVGSCFKDTKKDTGDVSRENVRQFMTLVKQYREGL